MWRHLCYVVMQWNRYFLFFFHYENSLFYWHLFNNYLKTNNPCLLGARQSCIFFLCFELYLHFCIFSLLWNCMISTINKMQVIKSPKQHLETYCFCSVSYYYLLLLLQVLPDGKCGHRNVLSKRHVWMSIFHIINFKKKKFMDTGVLNF